MLAPAALALGVLAASGWLAETRVGYVAACAIATVLGAIALYRIRSTPSRVACAVSLLALAFATVASFRAQLRLDQFARNPAEVSARERAAQQERLRVAVDAELSSLRSIALSSHALSA